MRANAKPMGFAAISFACVAGVLFAASPIAAIAQAATEDVAPLTATKFIRSHREFSEGEGDCSEGDSNTIKCHWNEDETSVPILLSGLYSRFILNSADDLESEALRRQTTSAGNMTLTPQASCRHTTMSAVAGCINSSPAAPKLIARG
jgi:hypothetical protein